ncbi:MAG: hypothetical protein FWF44_05625 [Defluviitaleaceae bacterium]|nr:hypothetical protein [Defluviitaleaceae bacterium]
MLLNSGPRIVYPPDADTDMRSAFGAALTDVFKRNRDAHPVVFDCDLRDSLKLGGIARGCPECLIECGVAEQNAVTAAAAAAKAGLPAFFADFGVFAIAEVYSQLRMADINRAPLKLFATHCGLDVGEDGKTHQCLDYLSLLRNLRHMEILLPADPNQADAMTRYAAASSNAVCVCMGRSKTPVLTDANGELLTFSGAESGFWLRRGTDAVVVTMGGMAARAPQASENVGVYAVTRPGVFDDAQMAEVMRSPVVVTYEDHFIENGLGSIIGLYLLEHGYRGRFSRLGVKNYGVSASPEELYRREGLDAASLAEHIKLMIRNG